MLYDGHDVIGNAKGYAYTDDLDPGLSTIRGRAHPPTPNAIMGAGYAGNAAFAWGDTMKVGSTYNMFVSRGPGTTVLATSTDLVTWTGFLSALTLVNDPGGTIGTGAAVLKEGDGITPIVVDDKYWMIYYPRWFSWLDIPGELTRQRRPAYLDLHRLSGHRTHRGWLGCPWNVDAVLHPLWGILTTFTIRATVPVAGIPALPKQMPTAEEIPWFHPPTRHPGRSPTRTVMETPTRCCIKGQQPGITLGT